MKSFQCWNVATPSPGPKEPPTAMKQLRARPCLSVQPQHLARSLAYGSGSIKLSAVLCCKANTEQCPAVLLEALRAASHPHVQTVCRLQSGESQLLPAVTEAKGIYSPWVPSWPPRGLRAIRAPASVSVRCLDIGNSPGIAGPGELEFMLLGPMPHLHPIELPPWIFLHTFICLLVYSHVRNMLSLEPKKAIKHCGSFFVVGGVLCKSLSLTTDRMFQHSRATASRKLHG